MKIKLTNKDIIWSYIGTVLSMASNLIILPFIVYFLDEDMLGLWYVFSSIGAIATLFDFGFSVTFSRNITYCWSGAKELKEEGVVFSDNDEPNYALMKTILTACKHIYFLISGIALMLMLSIGTLYIIYISRGLKGFIHIVAWIIYSIAVFLNLYYGYYSSFLRGVGAINTANINTVIARVAQIIVTIVALFAGMGILGVCLSYLLYGTVFRALGKEKFFSYKNIGESLKQVKSEPTKKDINSMFKIVWHNAWRDGIVGLSGYLSDQASTVICSFYLSLAETGIYSLAVQIATAVANISSTLYSAYQPELQAAYIENNMIKLRKLMSLIVISFVTLFLIGTMGVAIIGLPLIRIVKESANISLQIFLCVSLSQFILKFRNCYSSYFSSTNRIPYVNAFILSSIAGIALSVLFIGTFNYGVYGLIAGQIISQVVYNAWYWMLKAHNELSLSFNETVKIGCKETISVLKMIFKINSGEGQKYE